MISTYSRTNMSATTRAFCGESTSPASTTLPVSVNLGKYYERYCQDLIRASTRSETNCPANRATLWQLLFQLQEIHLENGQKASGNPAVRQTLLEIESRLSSPLYTEDLANKVGISKTHLNRLFQAQLKCSVQAYVVQQRCKKALSLLKETALGIKEIGAHVGIPDPHLFNKTFHRLYSCAPSRFRK